MTEQPYYNFENLPFPNDISILIREASNYSIKRLVEDANKLRHFQGKDLLDPNNLSSSEKGIVTYAQCTNGCNYCIEYLTSFELPDNISIGRIRTSREAEGKSGAHFLAFLTINNGSDSSFVAFNPINYVPHGFQRPEEFQQYDRMQSAVVGNTYEQLIENLSKVEPMFFGGGVTVSVDTPIRMENSDYLYYEGNPDFPTYYL